MSTMTDSHGADSFWSLEAVDLCDHQVIFEGRENDGLVTPFVQWIKMLILQDEDIESSCYASHAADWVKCMRVPIRPGTMANCFLSSSTNPAPRILGFPSCIRSQPDSAVVNFHAVDRRNINIVNEAERKLAEYSPCLMALMRTAMIESARRGCSLLQYWLH